MEFKDYLSLLSLLVSFSSLLLAIRSARKADAASAEAKAAKANTDAVEVISRKNDIVNDFQGVLILINEYRFYTHRLASILDALKADDDPDGHARIKALVDANLERMNAEQKRTKESIDKVRAFDSKQIATDPNARQMLQELHGRPQQLKIKLTGMINDMKRDLAKLGVADPFPAGTAE